MFRAENELIFLNRGELREYVNFLEKMVDSSFDTIFQVLDNLNLSYDSEYVLEDYIHEAKGPTVLESILIKDGTWSEEEIMRNFSKERIIKTLQKRLKKTEPEIGEFI